MLIFKTTETVPRKEKVLHGSSFAVGKKVHLTAHIVQCVLLTWAALTNTLMCKQVIVLKRQNVCDLLNEI